MGFSFKNKSFYTKTKKTENPLVSSKANRGMDFEHLLNQSNDMYKAKGIACIVKIPTAFIPKRINGAIASVMVKQKSICDYLGSVGNDSCAFGIPFAMEAKSVKDSQSSIRFDSVKPHQADFLSLWVSNGGVSVVVVSFGLNRFVCVPWAYWKEWGDDSKRKKSQHFEEFPKEMQFELGGRVPVDYLAVAQKNGLFQ